jgi:hypothetical protein
MITVTHTNVLSTYLADWAMNMRILAQTGSAKAIPLSDKTNVMRAVSTGERDINTVLRLIDDRLRILETRPFSNVENMRTLDFTVDLETVVLLKALYVDVRIYLDAISGTIAYFHKELALPRSFNKLLKKVGTIAIPEALSQVLLPAVGWFKTLKGTRDDLVHYYEGFLLLFDGSIIHHASHSKIDGNRAFDYGPIRATLGELLKNIQALADRLLDYFDNQFFSWYGLVQSSQSRNKTIFEGGYILYWAYKYGGYTHPRLEVLDE